LEELPVDASEEEAKEALEPTISELSQEIEKRQARKQREAQKANLIREGVAEVTYYLWRLKQDGEISAEDYLHSDLRAGPQGRA
jgi:DNA topoisomerase VI subunit B